MKTAVKKLSIGMGALLTAQGLLATTPDYTNYTIRTGDTLSEVLGNLGICPLWGKNNKLTETAKLNPSLIKKNGNFILPKKMIKLPVKNLAANDDFQVSESNEVFFTVPSPEFKCGPIYQARLKNKIEIRQVAEEVLEEVPPLTIPELPSSPPAEPPSSSYGILRATTDFFYSAMDIVDKTTGGKAQILSSLNHAYQFAWEQQWDKKNKTFLFYRTEKHEYESVQDKLPGKTYSLQGFGIGYERALSQNLNLRLIARSQEELFTRATSVTTIKMESAMIPEITLAPSYRLYSHGPFDLYGDLGFSYLMSSKTSNYSIKPGQRYAAGVSITQKIKDFELLGRSFYSVEDQASSIMKKTTRELGISFGVAWSFGK